LRQQLASIRARYLLLAALGSSLFIATADFMIKLLYDERYRAAGQMVPILVIGGWFTMLGGVNESTLWGLGRPSYSAIANTVRFVLLLIGLPVSFKLNGLAGGVMTLALVEVCRYVVIFFGQKRERFSFGRQDLGVTLMMFMLVGLWEWLRWAWGFGTSLDSLMESFPR
jgi:O-antigen/teichoic acid export membrane protein